MIPFRPKGERAEWRLIYDHLVECAIGEVVTADALGEVLGRDFDHEGSQRRPIYRAIEELQKMHQRTLLAVPGKGYQIVAGGEHIEVVVSHGRRTRLAAGRTARKAATVDRALLDHEQSKRIDAIQLNMEQIEERARLRDARIERLERLLKS